MGPSTSFLCELSEVFRMQAPTIAIPSSRLKYPPDHRPTIFRLARTLCNSESILQTLCVTHRLQYPTGQPPSPDALHALPREQDHRAKTPDMSPFSYALRKSGAVSRSQRPTR